MVDNQKKKTHKLWRVEMFASSGGIEPVSRLALRELP